MSQPELKPSPGPDPKPDAAPPVPGQVPHAPFSGVAATSMPTGAHSGLPSTSRNQGGHRSRREQTLEEKRAIIEEFEKKGDLIFSNPAYEPLRWRD